MKTVEIERDRIVTRAKTRRQRFAILINPCGSLTMKSEYLIKTYKESGWKVILNFHTTLSNMVLNSEKLKDQAYLHLVNNYKI